MFALGLLSWLYNRPDRGHRGVPQDASSRPSPSMLEANLAAFQAGWNFGETTEDFAVAYEVAPAPMPTGHLPQHHRQHRAGLRPGRRGAARRAAAGPRLLPDHAGVRHPAQLSRAQALRGHAPSRPRTRSPASARRWAPRSAGRSASPPRPGPGVALKARDHRAGRLPRAAAGRRRRPARRPVAPGCRRRPSRPTCCRRCSAATARRPSPIVAPRSPADCFDAALEAVRIATTYRTPVILLSDGYLANGSEPWLVPGGRGRCPTCRVEFARTQGRGRHRFRPYHRDPETLARPWAPPGTPGLEHRIGGIEKADGTGEISYDPDNHDHMVRLRQAKVDGIADVAAARGRRPDRGRRACWCSAGARRTARSAPAARAVRDDRRAGSRTAHLRHLNPFPANTGDVLRRYRRSLVPGDEPRASSHCCCVPGTWSTRGLQPGARRARSSPPSSPTPSASSRGGAVTSVDDSALPACRRGPGCEGVPAAGRGRAQADEEGLHLRPGGPLVPRLRRLRDPRRHPGLPARARAAPGEHRLHLRHRLLVAVPVLPGHLRPALDPRPRAGDRDRAGDVPART